MPDQIKLNIMVNGIGTVWIDDIHLSKLETTGEQIAFVPIGANIYKIILSNSIKRPVGDDIKKLLGLNYSKHHYFKD